MSKFENSTILGFKSVKCRHDKFRAYWESIGSPPREILCTDGTWVPGASAWLDYIDYRIADDKHWELRQKWVDSDFTLPIEVKEPGCKWGLTTRPSWHPSCEYREAKEPVPTGDWIEWNGGECPVNPDCIVNVKLRRGAFIFARPANLLRWEHLNNFYLDDIVSYRPSDMFLATEDEPAEFCKSGIKAREIAKKHAQYFKNVEHLDEIDIYRVLELFDVTNPAIAHAIKKLMCACHRGVQDTAKDVAEAIDTLQRWQEMRDEDSQ